MKEGLNRFRGKTNHDFYCLSRVLPIKVIMSIAFKFNTYMNMTLTRFFLFLDNQTRVNLEKDSFWINFYKLVLS